jgi:hypothetical protein
MTEPSLNEDHCRNIAKKYFDVVYNNAFRNILGSVTEEEYKTVKNPDMFNLDMDYDEYIEAITKGSPEIEVNDTIEKITQFLHEYVIFQEDIYVTLMTEMSNFLINNTNVVKQNIAESIQVKNSNNHDTNDEEEVNEVNEYENEVNEDEVREQKKLKTITSVDSQTQQEIDLDNELRGVLKVRISGKDIEVETNGNCILTQTYHILFTLFCMTNNMTMEHVLSDRPVIYKSPFDSSDSDKEFSLILDKIDK